MLYKRPDSPYWWTRFTVGGRRTRCSTETTDKHQAREFERRLRERQWHRAQGTGHTWDDACLQWLDEHEHKRSLDKDRIILQWTRQGRLRDMPLTAITRDVLFQLRQEKAAETSPATANRYLALIRAILRAARDEWEWLPKIPKVPMFRAEPEDYQWLTPDEFAALLAHLPPHTRQLARFAVATGLRRTNITHLRWSQIDLKRRHFAVSAQNAKGKRPIPVPLSPDALSVLKEQRGQHPLWVFPYQGRPISQVATKAWRAAVQAIGRPGFRFHDLRHTWATWHVQAGTDLYVLMRLGGWASLTLVQRYAHHDSRSLRDLAKPVRVPGHVSGTSTRRTPRRAA